jgi:hypothetical protein
MAQLFRPARIEYDIFIAHPDHAESSAGLVSGWTTAAVDAVAPSPLSGLKALREYTLCVVPRVQDFAYRVTMQRGRGQPSAPINDGYRRVRSMIRDKDGNALARVHAHGSILLPGELDSDLRRGIIGLVNFGLPMMMRAVDEGNYENALGSLVKARTLLGAALQAVLNLAVSAPEPPSREQLAHAMKVRPEELDDWFNGQTTAPS